MKQRSNTENSHGNNNNKLNLEEKNDMMYRHSQGPNHEGHISLRTVSMLNQVDRPQRKGCLINKA
jgi:hypothetical protein